KKTSPERWLAQTKLAVVAETYTMTEHELSTYCRSKGLYPEQIHTWREECLHGFRSSKEKKALAETSALLAESLLRGRGRGRLTSIDERQALISLIHEAVDNGSRLPNACLETEIDLRTYRRWYRGGEVQEDQRPLAVRQEPANKLTEKERLTILDVCNAPEYASLPPTQIVPTLLDKGIYLGSESTFYSTLRKEGQVEQRGRQRARKKVARPSRYTATAPKQVLTWDITYLPAAVRGQHYYLYLIEGIYNRKIVGYEVYEQESGEKASQLLQRTLMREQFFNQALVLHSDNGSSMKSSTMKAKMEELGVTSSYSRPRVSDDNPYVESLFRTLKYIPNWPSEGCASLEESRAWVDRFVKWYNNEHKHRGRHYVTPSERHAGKDSEILQKRAAVLEVRREQNPERWSGEIRNCKPVGDVHRNPEKEVA
ncbi:IS3 family transposase, partial [Vibrio parahaemolyticus]|uniref:IS3 family transposase n=1 Tax=Vibrio parahaemolyticus TaxID=670 RepID=UPI0009AF4E0F